MCTSHFVVMFNGGDSSGSNKRSCNAYISRSTRGLRSMLREHVRCTPLLFNLFVQSLHLFFTTQIFSLFYFVTLIIISVFYFIYILLVHG